MWRASLRRNSELVVQLGEDVRALPRQWYFRHVVAHHAAKDPLRREAYLLTKVDSIWSWRGKVVDDLITEQVVPGLTVGHLPSLQALTADARRRFDTQLEFAANRASQEEGLKPNQRPYFLALRETQEGAGLEEAGIERAWADIENALTKLLAMRDLLERLASAAVLLPQRALSYRRILSDGEPLTVRAVPDLIAFFSDAPPLIVDWKVYAHAKTTFADQLAGYALALVAAAGQWGLPRLDGWRASDIELLEVQLLADEQRSHELTSEEFWELRDYQLESGERMRRLVAGRAKSDRDPYTVVTTTDLSKCENCVFQPLCWDRSDSPRFEAEENQPLPYGRRLFHVPTFKNVIASAMLHLSKDGLVT